MDNVVVSQVRRFQTAISFAILAALAYIPAMTASPGRMPSDSKLYVYLNPGRFLADATTSFDPRQFAGWVPHQHIAYLWPTGPWFWTLDTLGAPDWVAHRLWIGTLLVVAGLGVRYLARVLGANPLAALVAALVYQLSPYVLPYISRTSVLLLPWAGLGWIVAFTVLATRRPGWRYPAAIALVVFTVGAVNATALAMVIPAPALWLVHAAWARSITWRKALTTAVQAGVLCLAVSSWWIVMLMIQGRHGADVLAYSESLEAVSFTSTSTEVTRGLGYWLFYVRDAYAATTTASIDHLASGRTVLLGWMVILTGLVGIVACRWEHRRFAALLVGAGIVLGVGVHPIDDPSPLMSLLVGDGEGGLALALRSSTRAVPVMLLGLALGAAQVVMHVRLPASRMVPGSTRDASRYEPDPKWDAVVRIATAAAIGLVAIVALPALRNGGFVDQALERDQQPPEAWLDAAAELDRRPDGYRLLQVPGTEFGAFQWGYTVDQPLPALTERGLITRDLLPLGSPAAMDLAFALDDRFQIDTIEPDAVQAVARLMGVDTIWISGDVAYDRFRLARPEVVLDELSELDQQSFGEPAVMGTPIPMIDNRSLGDPRVGEPIAPVVLADVSNPVPIERVKDEVVVLAGSGDGVIDAAAAGVIDGTEAILYSASLDDGTPLPDVYRFVVTDSNRDRAHHWRSSQDVTGFTESADTESDVLRFESGDQRLPVFDDQTQFDQTVSVQDGPITAEASSYGERFAYLPEHRPVMAIDGDPDTAWIVADRAPAIGEFIRLVVEEPIDHVDLLQPPSAPGDRTITEVSVQVNGLTPVFHALGDASREGGGQRIDLDSTLVSSAETDAGVDGTPAVITIAITGTTEPQPPIGDAIGGVGFAEISTGLESTTEIIRVPSGGSALAAASGVDIVLTRLRHEPTDRWRDDPEPVLARQFELPDAVTADPSITLRLDRRLDDAQLAGLLGEPVVATSHLTGAPRHRGAAAFDGDDTTTWITPFDDVVAQSVTYRGAGTASEMTIAQPGGDTFSPITALRVIDGSGSFEISIPPGADTLAELPREIDLERVTLEVAAVDERWTQNRRFNEPTLLPAALSEIQFDEVSPEVTARAQLESDCRDDLLTVDDAPVAVSFSIETTDALRGEPIEATVCGDPIDLTAGTHRVVSVAGADTGFDVDRVTLSTAADPAGSSLDPVRQDIVGDGESRSVTLVVPPCPRGCWVIHGQGYNEAWTATADGRDLGTPQLVDGNANGWWLDASDTETTVDVRWPVQRQLNVAFLFTALAVLACLGLVVRRTRSAAIAAVGPAEDIETSARRRSPVWAIAAASTIAGAVLIDWVWAAPIAAIWALALGARQRRLVAWSGLAIVIAAALVVTFVVSQESPFPDAGWPVRFEWLHPWTLLAVVLLVSGSLTHDARTASDRRPTSEVDESGDRGVSPDA